MTVTLHYLVGIPGSGKSTYAKVLKNKLELNKESVSYISTDEYRQEMFNSLLPFDKENERKMNQRINSEIDLIIHESNKLKTNVHIIYDKTNSVRKLRMVEYEHYKGKKYRNVIIKLHIMATPLTKALLNNEKRINKINGEALPNYVNSRNIISKYCMASAPRIGMDCDSYELIYSDNIIDKIFIEKITAFLSDDTMSGTYQNQLKLSYLLENTYSEFADMLKLNFAQHDSPYHIESIDEHIDKVTELAYNIESVTNGKYKSSKKLVIAALCHDLGKGIVKGKFWQTHKGAYRAHELVGSMIAFLLINQINDDLVKKYELNDVPELVLNHMLPHYNSNGSLTKKRIKRFKYSQEFVAIQEQLALIDNLGKISER